MCKCSHNNEIVTCTGSRCADREEVLEGISAHGECNSPRFVNPRICRPSFFTSIVMSNANTCPIRCHFYLQIWLATIIRAWFPSAINGQREQLMQGFS